MVPHDTFKKYTVEEKKHQRNRTSELIKSV